jgi:hypothetical protein
MDNYLVDEDEFTSIVGRPNDGMRFSSYGHGTKKIKNNKEFVNEYAGQWIPDLISEGEYVDAMQHMDAMRRQLDDDVRRRGSPYSPFVTRSPGMRETETERLTRAQRQAQAEEAASKAATLAAKGRLSTYVDDLWQVEQLESTDKHCQAFGADKAKFEAHHRAALTAKFGADLRRSPDGKTFVRWIDDELLAIRDRKKLVENMLSSTVQSAHAVTTELELVTGAQHTLPALKDLNSAQRHLASTKHLLELANMLVLQLQEQVETKLRRRYWASLSSAVQRDLAPSTLGGTKAKALFAEHEAAARASVLASLSQIPKTVPSMEAALAGLRDVEVKTPDDKCPQCGKHLARRKRGYDGAVFIGCTGYPTCVYAWSVELGDRIEMRTLAAVLAEGLVNVDAQTAWHRAGLPDSEWLSTRTSLGPHDSDVTTWLWALGNAQEHGAIERLRDASLALGVVDKWRNRAKKAWSAWLGEAHTFDPVDDLVRECLSRFSTRYFEQTCSLLDLEVPDTLTDALRWRWLFQRHLSSNQMTALQEHLLVCAPPSLEKAWSAWLGGDVAYVKNERNEALSALVEALSERIGLDRLRVALERTGLTWSIAVDDAVDTGTSLAHATWRRQIEAARSQGQSKLEQLRRALKFQLTLANFDKVGDLGWFDELWTAWTGECTRAKEDGNVMVRKVKGESMTEYKAVVASTSTISGLMAAGVEMAKDDLGDATWRTAATEAIELAKVPVKAGLKRVTGFGKPFAKFMHDAVDTPLGEGALAVTLGFGIAAYAPLCGKTLGPKTVRLSKELRVWGFEKYTSKVARFIIAPIRNELTALVESLPGLASLES